jgi:hypothetical protein
LMGHSRADSPAAGHYGKSNQAHPKFKAMRQEKRRLQQGSEQSSSPTERQR